MAEDKKQKILIVEDEEMIRKAYVEELRDDGFTVFVAENGQKGLEIALREKPDLILLDILMPVMDGITMMNELRNDELKNKYRAYGKNVPLIFLTNLEPNEQRIMEAITKNEPAYYLIKSDWRLSQVVEKIKERLARKM